MTTATLVATVVAPVSAPVNSAVNPSINLAALNVPTKVVVSNTTPVAQSESVEQLKSLETARISW
jgi:hypothetical protein